MNSKDVSYEPFSTLRDSRIIPKLLEQSLVLYLTSVLVLITVPRFAARLTKACGKMLVKR
jgi:hypothetical protein